MASVTAQIVRPTGVRGTVAKSTTGRLIAHTTPIPKRTSIVPRASAEPDWKTKQREQDALISVEEDAVKTRVEELLAPILDSGSGTAGDATAPASGAPADLAGKIRAATSALESGLVERETEVRLLLLAAFCGEHLLLLGPPGTAKSELGRRLSAVCGDGGVFFERLLTRFSVPEELFGPLSMRGLENDQYVRQTDGYLPDATVAFVDEVFKANSAILNSLLTILNERLFDNGNERVEVPLLCLVGASNELPESEELDALYDRFLLRSCVEQVSSSALSGLLSMKAGELPGKASGSVNQMANNINGNAMPLKVSDFQGVKAAAEAAVDVPQSVVDLIVDLRAHLQNKCEPPVYVSDRRLVKSVALLRVAAYTNGRASVSEFDCLLLANVLWQRPSEAQVVREWILERLAQDRGVDQEQYLLAGLFGRADGDKTECEALRAEAASLREVLSSQINQLAGTTSGSLPALREHLWLSPPDAERAAQTLGPLFSKVRRGLEKLLRECLTLEVALERATEPHVMALLLPDYWADFIRSGPIEDVKPLGVGGAGKP